MTQRDANLLWLGDLLDQLKQTQQQLHWCEDAETIELLSATMLRDLTSCRRLCDALRHSSCNLAPV